MNEPKYDEDTVNLGYLNRKLEDVDNDFANTTSEINKRSQNFGTQPNPPYFVNDTYMDGENIYICNHSRVIGSFEATDWELASDYITDGYLGNKLGNLGKSVEDILKDFQNQIDNVVDVWTEEGAPTLLNEPAVNWNTPELLQQHVGDVYTDVLTGYSYRFIYHNNAYSWLEISDSQATAAYALANEAKTLANGKMRVFLSQPTPPYNIGDLWSQGKVYPIPGLPDNPGILMRCKTAKLSGVYDASDWEPAVGYDETATVIRNGLITTGTITVKQGGVQTAGMTGNVSGDTAIRFWAGSSFDSRGTAPFRVTQGGKLTATGVDVTGKITATEGSFTGAVTATSGSFTGSITATSGTIGGWNIRYTYIDSTSGKGRFYLASNADSSGYYIQATGTDGVTRFSLGKNGVVTATGVNITGAVTATSGSFTGAITATSGRVGPWHINSSGIYSNATDSLIYSDGRLRVCPLTGGRINAGSAGFLINGDGGTRPVVISDYIESSPGGSGTSIGLRAIYGNIRIASEQTITLTGKTLNLGGSRINSLGSYVLKAHTFTGGGGASMYANSNCMLSPASGYYAYIKSTAASNRIATSSGGGSSKNIKTNINVIDTYRDVYSDLQDLKLYTFDYKYKGIKDYVHDFGFIIDDIEKSKTLSTYARHYKTTCGFIDDNTLCDKRDGDKEFANRKKIKIKEWDRDSYIKMLFVLIKALQIKIDELEVRLNEGKTT